MNAYLVRKYSYTPAQRRRTTMVLDGQRMGDERDWVLVGFFVTCSSSAQKRFIRPAKQDEMGLWQQLEILGRTVRDTANGQNGQINASAASMSSSGSSTPARAAAGKRGRLVWRNPYRYNNANTSAVAPTPHLLHSLHRLLLRMCRDDPIPTRPSD